MIRMFKYYFLFLIFITDVNITFCHNLVGYWHNWRDVNAPYIYLDSINNLYDYVEVAFAVPTSTTDMTMIFTPDVVTKSTFISQVQTLQSQGKKVLLSIGGANTSVDLTTQVNKNLFISSLNELLDTYGFDGLDIDIEHGNSILITGGTIDNPSNVAQKNLIEAIRSIMSTYRINFSKKMLLTLAPETAYVQGGQSGFGNIWGGYLPILHALRDSLDIVQVQLYNSGTMYGLDGKIYTQGTADFIVAMTEAVIKGFNTNGGMFVGLPPNKIAVGLPASIDAAGGGFVDTNTAFSALNYLMGKSGKPGNYTLLQSGGYTNLRGMMTWSINWDAKNRNNINYEFANNYSKVFLNDVPEKVRLIKPEINEILYGKINFSWYVADKNILNYHLEIYNNSTMIFNDSTITDTNITINPLIPGENYTWKIKAKNALGWGEWSNANSFSILQLPNAVIPFLPENNELINKRQKTIIWNKSTPSVNYYQLQIVKEDINFYTDSNLTDTTFFLQNLESNSNYSWQVRAKNNSGWGIWSETRYFKTIQLPNQIKLNLPIDNAIINVNNQELSWLIPNYEVINYQIEIYKDSILITTDSTITNSLFQIINIAEGIYSWRVRAKNDFGWGEWSDRRGFQYIILPNKVLNILPENNSISNNSSINFVWNNSLNTIAYYHIEIFIDNNILISDSTLIDTVFYFDKFEYGNTYKWRVRAKNLAGWGEWSELWQFSLDDQISKLPEKVKLIIPNDNSLLLSKNINFNWNKNSNYFKYWIEILQNNLLFVSDSTINDTVFYFDKFEYGSSYKWRVRAKNDFGWGEWSEFWEFSIDKNTNINNDYNLINEINIYPNPSTNTIRITNSQMYNQVEIYDVFGNLVNRIVINNNLNIELNIENFHNGVYTVIFKNSYQTINKFLHVRK